MSDDAKKLEAISLLRFLPAGTANLGEDVTRADMREMGFGPWSAAGSRSDDLRRELEPGEAEEAASDPKVMADFDEVMPLEEAAVRPGERVVELCFSKG